LDDTHGLVEIELNNIRDRREAVIGLRMTFSVFNKHLARTEKRKRLLEITRLKQPQIQTERELTSKIERMSSELDLIYELIEKSEKISKRANDYLELVLGEYRRRVKGSLDVLSVIKPHVARLIRERELRYSYLTWSRELSCATREGIELKPAAGFLPPHAELDHSPWHTD
jgi:hypothetical protein